jgi:hypothetical protein
MIQQKQKHMILPFPLLPLMLPKVAIPDCAFQVFTHSVNSIISFSENPAICILYVHERSYSGLFLFIEFIQGRELIFCTLDSTLQMS